MAKGSPSSPGILLLPPHGGSYGQDPQRDQGRGEREDLPLTPQVPLEQRVHKAGSVLRQPLVEMSQGRKPNPSQGSPSLLKSSSTSEPLCFLLVGGACWPHGGATAGKEFARMQCRAAPRGQWDHISTVVQGQGDRDGQDSGGSLQGCCCHHRSTPRTNIAALRQSIRKVQSLTK